MHTHTDTHEHTHTDTHEHTHTHICIETSRFVDNMQDKVGVESIHICGVGQGTPHQHVLI